MAIPADAKPEDETCVPYDVDWTLHCSNLPHTKTMLNLLTMLCWFVLAPDAVFTGNNRVPPTPSKRSIISRTEVRGKDYSF